ncbi:MAG: NAD(P)-dependent oxidoreductase [Nitrososphaeria archaeon]|jgi:ketol-acid reductoisomerase
MGRLITSLTEEQRNKVWRSIKDKTVAVIGYGNQGRSQALNMRDSGLNVIVGNVRDQYAEQAEKDGFKVYSIGEAAGKADILFILIPDEIQPEVFENEINRNFKEGGTVVFASGYNYFYGLVKVPEKANVLMIAPRMIGFGIRDLYLKG